MKRRFWLLGVVVVGEESWRHFSKGENIYGVGAEFAAS
jgi:hypothetical protein